MLSSLAFWIGVAYVILAIFAGWIYYEGNRTTRETTIRQARAAADVSARKSDCLRSIPQIERINAFLDGVGILATVLETNSIALLAVTPKDDPQYVTLKANLGRLAVATKAIEEITFPVPTKKRCEAITS